MGILQLSKLIGDKALSASKETEMKNLFGRKIAIDASMSLYSFLIAVRTQDGAQLIDESGETTSHLQGMWSRTIRFLEMGIKPVYVFDGKPPTLKSGELAVRRKKKEDAEEAAKDAADTGDKEEELKQNKRSVRVTREQNEEAKRLLRLMGVPVVEAPTEAEAQCAELARGGKVWAAGSEDMDTLTFGTPTLVRHLTYSEARKMPIIEVSLARILEDFGLTMDQFIDLCILCGCDYCEKIPKIGYSTAFDLIKEYKTLEVVLEVLKTRRNGKGQLKYTIPDPWPYEDIRELFRHPDVTPADEIELKWTEPDEEGLVQFLVKEKGFAEDRIRRGLEKIKKSRTTSVQGRLDGFFTVEKRPSDAASPAGKKVKKDDKKKKPSAAAAAAAGSKRGRPRK